MLRNEAIFNRVFRDMEEAVFVIERDGNVVYVNEKCESLLGFRQESETKQKYAELMSRDTDSRNDDFHQVILDAVYDVHNVHKRDVPYYRNGKKRMLNLRTSFLRDDEGAAIGIVAVLEDVTELYTLQRQKRNSNIVFALFVAFLCLIIFAVQCIADFELPVSKKQITVIIEVLAVALLFILMKTTHLSVSDMGFRTDNLRQSLTTSGIIVVILFGVLIVFKYLLMQLAPSFFPKGAPFFARVPALEFVTYLFTAMLQELIARGAVQSSLNRIFDGKHGKTVVLIISSLAFGAIHLHYGFLFMLMAGSLVGVLGILFNRQKSIWGVTLIHYSMGMIATVLGFLG